MRTNIPMLSIFVGFYKFSSFFLNHLEKCSDIRRITQNRVLTRLHFLSGILDDFDDQSNFNRNLIS